MSSDLLGSVTFKDITINPLIEQKITRLRDQIGRMEITPVNTREALIAICNILEDMNEGNVRL